MGNFFILLSEISSYRSSGRAEISKEEKSEHLFWLNLILSKTGNDIFGNWGIGISLPATVRIFREGTSNCWKTSKFFIEHELRVIEWTLGSLKATKLGN